MSGRPGLIEMQEDAPVQDAVLAVLPTHRDRSMSQRQVHRRAAVVAGNRFLSLEAVRKALDKLVRRGVVCRDQVRREQRWTFAYWRTT